MRMVSAAGNMWVVLMYSLVVFTLFINDLFRCGSIARKEWFSCDNQMDVSWYMVTSVSIPLLFQFTALVLGTHDLLMLQVVVILTFISACAAESKDFLRVLMNTEKIPCMKGTVMFMLQTIHDLTLFISMIIILLPIMYNIVHAPSGISTLEFAIAIAFMCLYIAMVTTQYTYEYRCNIVENRWPSEKAVIAWNSPRQEKLSEPVIQSTEVVFPRFPVTNKEDSKNNMVKGDQSALDPFNVETSEQLFDRIYYGCYLESATEHVKQLVWTPTGSFRKSTNQVDGLTRKTVGLRVEWARYYAINMAINTLLVLGILKLSGFVLI